MIRLIFIFLLFEAVLSKNRKRKSKKDDLLPKKTYFCDSNYMDYDEICDIDIDEELFRDMRGSGCPIDNLLNTKDKDGIIIKRTFKNNIFRLPKSINLFDFNLVPKEPRIQSSCRGGSAYLGITSILESLLLYEIKYSSIKNHNDSNNNKYEIPHDLAILNNETVNISQKEMMIRLFQTGLYTCDVKNTPARLLNALAYSAAHSINKNSCNYFPFDYEGLLQINDENTEKNIHIMYKFEDNKIINTFYGAENWPKNYKHVYQSTILNFNREYRTHFQNNELWYNAEEIKKKDNKNNEETERNIGGNEYRYNAKYNRVFGSSSGIRTRELKELINSKYNPDGTIKKLEKNNRYFPMNIAPINKWTFSNYNYIKRIEEMKTILSLGIPILAEINAANLRAYERSKTFIDYLFYDNFIFKNKPKFVNNRYISYHFKTAAVIVGYTDKNEWIVRLTLDKKFIKDDIIYVRFDYNYLGIYDNLFVLMPKSLEDKLLASKTDTNFQELVKEKIVSSEIEDNLSIFHTLLSMWFFVIATTLITMIITKILLLFIKLYRRITKKCKEHRLKRKEEEKLKKSMEEFVDTFGEDDGSSSLPKEDNTAINDPLYQSLLEKSYKLCNSKNLKIEDTVDRLMELIEAYNKGTLKESDVATDSDDNTNETTLEKNESNVKKEENVSVIDEIIKNNSNNNGKNNFTELNEEADKKTKIKNNNNNKNEERKKQKKNKSSKN